MVSDELLFSCLSLGSAEGDLLCSRMCIEHEIEMKEKAVELELALSKILELENQVSALTARCGIREVIECKDRTAVRVAHEDQEHFTKDVSTPFGLPTRTTTTTPLEGSQRA